MSEYLVKPKKNNANRKEKVRLTTEEIYALIKKHEKTKRHLPPALKDLPDDEALYYLAVKNDNLELLNTFDNWQNITIDGISILAYIIGLNAVEIYRYAKIMNYIDLNSTKIPVFLFNQKITVDVPICLFICHQDFVREAHILKAEVLDVINIYHRDVWSGKTTLYDYEYYTTWQSLDWTNPVFEDFMTRTIKNLPPVQRVVKCLQIAQDNINILKANV